MEDAEAEYRLVVQAQAGDPRAFGALVRKYQDRVFRFVLRMVGSREEAMDLTQDTFIKAHRALPQWRPQAQFRTWLFRIAHNATLDLLRRRQCIDFVNLDALDADAAGADLAPLPEQALAGRQSIALLEQSLRELAAEQREVLLLRELEDMSYADIAVLLDIAEGTVKSRLARARSAALAAYRRLSGEYLDE
jgi:RNA polymerase sigma factor (sigma-70 family)